MILSKPLLFFLKQETMSGSLIATCSDAPDDNRKAAEEEQDYFSDYSDEEEMLLKKRNTFQDYLNALYDSDGM